MAEREAPDETVTSIDMGPARAGQVIAIGGAEDRNPTCQESILAEFVRLTVLGSGAVTIVDGRNTTSDYFDRAPGEIATVIDSHLFALGPGRQFDLRTRRPLPLDDDRQVATGTRQSGAE